MSVLALYPADPAPELAQLLDLSGFVWKGVDHPSDVDNLEPDEGWGGAIVQVGADGDSRLGHASALRKRDVPVSPLLLIIRGSELQELELRDDLFDDFCLDPFHPRELEARIKHMLATKSKSVIGERIEYGPLLLDLETYEASVNAQPLDLTFMEYEFAVLSSKSRTGIYQRGTSQQSLGLRILRWGKNRRRSCSPTQGQSW